jgi:hypothetical protein
LGSITQRLEDIMRQVYASIFELPLVREPFPGAATGSRPGIEVWRVQVILAAKNAGAKTEIVTKWPHAEDGHRRRKRKPLANRLFARGFFYWGSRI